MNSVTKTILLFHLFLSVIVAIDVTCDRVNPLIQSDVTCTCKNTPGTKIDWLIDDVFNSNCALSSKCAPQYSGYNYSMNTTENVFMMTINSYDYSSCTKITCKDESDGSIKQSIIPSSLVFDTTFPTSMTEPGSNNSNGIISVTTGCISGYLDVQYDWYIIVGGLEERYFVYDTNIIDTIDTSPCVNCDTDVNGQRTIGFEHSEASGSGTKTGHFKVSLYHVSTNFQLNLTSKYYYTLKANKQIESDGDVLLCDTPCIAGISLGIVLLPIIFIVTIVIVYYFVRPKFTMIELKDTKIHLLWTDRLYCCRWCRINYGYNIVCNPVKGQVMDIICQKQFTKVNHCTLDNLHPMAIYEIRLSRKLCCFKSISTKRSVITRKHGMLIDQVCCAKSTSIDVRWTQPDCITNWGLRYQVICNEMVKTTKHDQTNITINDLIPGEMYTIEVFAIDKGTNRLLLAKDISTTPINVKLEDVRYEPEKSSVKCHIKWRVENCDIPETFNPSENFHFNVICRKEEENVHIKENITHSRYTIPGLNPDCSYFVDVYAIYKARPLEPPSKIQLTPYKPTNLDYTVTSTQIELQWRRPEYVGNQQLNYEVTCNEGEGKTTNDTSFKLEKLNPRQQYDIKIFTIFNGMKSLPLQKKIRTIRPQPCEQALSSEIHLHNVILVSEKDNG